MRWLLGVAIVGLVLPAQASNCGMVGKLAAQFVGSSNAINIELGLTNHSKRNLCFILHDSGPVMRTRSGGSLPMRADGDLATLQSYGNVVNVVWADGKLHVFHADVGAGKAFQTDGKIGNVREVSYRVVVYDCAKLMAGPPGKAPAIDVIDLVGKPTKA